MKVMDCHHFFTTGSCAEFYLKPLKRILSIYIKETTGTEINLEDPNILFKAIEDNSFNLLWSIFLKGAPNLTLGKSWDLFLG